MYGRVLKEVTGLDSIKDLCIRVDLHDLVYPLCFIHSETLKYLIVYSTGDDGNERLVVIPKSEIVSVGVVYQQDIDNIFEDDGKDEIMFG